jgi:predicted amidohydrolase YtcJ
MRTACLAPLAMLLASCTPAENGPPVKSAGGETAVIYTAAVVHTLDPKHPKARAVRVEDGRITHVLDEAPPADLPGKRVDLGGAAILPGLVDAHLHLHGLGRAAREVDLRGTRSPEEVADRVHAAAEKAPPGAWIHGRGWDQNNWPQRDFAGHAVLDRAAPGRAVLLSRVDGHAVWASAAALAAAGIDASTKTPAGGEILRDATGAPTGVLIDNAMSLVERAVPPATPAEIRADLERGMELCRGVGLTAVHDMGTEPAVLRELRALESEGRVTLRVYAYLGGEWSAVEPLLREPPDHEGLVQVVGIKLFADGALGSRGAALFKPYSDRPDTSGLLVTPEEDLKRRAMTAHRAGYAVTIHAIGDRGNRIALDALAAANALGGPPMSHRVEHAQVLAPEDIPRFAKERIVASMQPTHATSDMPWAEARVGPDRIQGAYAWRTMLNTGATLVFGSDAPVEGESPWLGIYAAVTRMDTALRPPGGWRPEERVTMEEALTAFSITPSRVVNAKEIGSITAGHWADLTVVGADPFTMNVPALMGLVAVRTIVAGREVYVR